MWGLQMSVSSVRVSIISVCVNVKSEREGAPTELCRCHSWRVAPLFSLSKAYKKVIPFVKLNRELASLYNLDSYQNAHQIRALPRLFFR